MHRRWKAVLRVAPALALSCGASPDADAPPYAAVGSLTEPRIFAQGTVSTAAPEFATSFAPDGRVVYFNLATHDRSELKIVASEHRNGSWRAAKAMPFSDGTWRDIDPFVSPDGNRLYFSSNRPLQVGGPAADYNTWFVKRRETGWSEPIPLEPPVNTPLHEIFVSVAASGNLYFSSQVEGSENFGIFRCKRTTGGYAGRERIMLGDSVDVGNPCISADERMLIFSSSSLPGEGGSDLFVSYNEPTGWTAPANLGTPINSGFSDFAPGLSPDGRYLFFTSERPGVVAAGAVQGRPPGDIFQVSAPR